MASQVRISLLRDQLEHLDAVIALGDRFKRKLGLFPREAFEQSARSGHVLIAHTSALLIGYLLFRVSKRHPRRATVIHLCVAPERRGEGVARKLVDELKSQTRELDGIGLSCRRDYEENGLWPRLGFQLLGEKRGKSKAGTALNIWWFAHGSPLLSYMSKSLAQENVVVALDANVVFDLESEDPASRESQALLSDWLGEQVHLVVTPELNNEINRREEREERERSRLIANRFQVLQGDGSSFEAARSTLSNVLGPPSDDNQASDIRQLAWSVAGDAEYFVTRDQELLDNAREIAEAVDIAVVRPSEIIAQFDELINGAAYQPRRFEGSLLEVRPVDPKSEKRLVDGYLDFSACEKKGPFIGRIRAALASHPGQVREIVGPNKEPYILYQLEDTGDKIAVPLLRASSSRLAPTVLRQFLTSLAFGRGGTSVLVTEGHLNSVIEDALAETHYIKLQSGWLKPTLRYIGPATGITTLLAPHLPSCEGRGVLQQLGETVAHARREQCLATERVLSPAKFTDINIPCYVISIRPMWASQLFDTGLAEQELFGLPPELGFRLENVYYKSAQFALQAPARILWYVSMGTGRYAGSGAIRAASYLDEVIVGRPKDLYSRFRRLGVYQWNNILELTNGKLDAAVMALRFSGTELLSKPVGWADIQARFTAHTGKGSPLLSPVQITSKLFFELYSEATATPMALEEPP